MTITVSEQLEASVKERAERLQISTDRFISQAISWYLSVDPELLEEIAAWQAAGLESWDKLGEY